MLSSYSYAYYADGNQRTKTDNASRITTYTYDGAGRLKTESESTGYGAAYQYNAFGNRTSMTVTGADAYTTTYDYDANNRLRTESKAVSTSTLVTNYYYDPNGNQLSKVSEALVAAGSGTPVLSLGKTGTELYKYDGFNRMTEANIGGDIVSYDYRADGLRNSKTSNAGVVTHLWDGGSIVADVPNVGTTEVYLRGVGLIMATGSSTAYYLYNGHGDVVQLTGTNGAVTKSYDYDAFGVERSPVSSDANPWRYCGEYFDAETGTVYLRARYYSPGTGRFSAEDPIRDGLNWYTYCYNNPVMFIDPWGLSGNVVVNESEIGNTQIINGQVYGSVRDFVTAVGGFVWEAGNGYCISIGGLGIGPSFIVDPIGKEIGTEYTAEVNRGGKIRTISYTAVDIGNGYVQTLVSLQTMVDLAGDLVTSLAYNLGNMGGTVVINNSLNYVFMPPDVALDYVSKYYAVQVAVEMAHGTDWSALGISAAGVMDLKIIESAAHNHNPFMRIKNERGFLWGLSPSTMGVSAYTPNASNGQGTLYNISGKMLPMFYYGQYYNPFD